MVDEGILKIPNENDDLKISIDELKSVVPVPLSEEKYPAFIRTIICFMEEPTLNDFLLNLNLKILKSKRKEYKNDCHDFSFKAKNRVHQLSKDYNSFFIILVGSEELIGFKDNLLIVAGSEIREEAISEFHDCLP
jgi:hypothetical protein